MWSMRLILPALAMLAIFTPTVGRADPYKWCAEYDMRGGGGSNCGFVTYAQCLATISGIGGVCRPNPFYSGPDEQRTARKRNRDAQLDR
jgi:hypothetical protein